MLAAIRKRLGISQEKAAYLLGTSQSNISRYEKGNLTPGPLVSQRIQLLGQLSEDSAYVDNPYLTMPALAATIHREAVPTDDRSWGIRLAAQAVSDIRSLEQDADVNLFLAPPSGTGSDMWDALLSGIAEREAKRFAVPHPAWIYGPPLPRLTWVTKTNGMEAVAFTHTPPELRVRGVMVDAASLESV